MKILIFEPTGGFWPYSPNFSNCIANSTNEVYLLTSRDRLGLEYDNLNFMPICKSMKNFNPKRNSLFWIFNRTFVAISWLIKRNKILRSLDIDILHIQSTPTIFDIYFIKFIPRKVKVILTVHDVLPLTSTKYNTNFSLKKFYSRSNIILVHSKMNKLELINKFQINDNKIHIIPHIAKELDLNSLPSRERSLENLEIIPNKFNILFFGGIRKSKGLNILLDAIKLLDNEDIHLIIAGKPSWDMTEIFIRGEIHKLGIFKFITFDFEYIPDSKVTYYFRSSDLVVLPYLEFHSQSGVLLQAYQYGLPVIVSDKGSLGETVEEDETGIVMKTLNSHEIAKNILTMIYDSKRYDLYSKNAKNIIKRKYSCEIVDEEIRRIYKILI